MKQDLLAIIVSWNRPKFLERTITSLQQQLQGLSADLCVVDNGSGQETRQLIRQNRSVSGYLLLHRNLGINGALERVFPRSLSDQYEFLLISDADMEYRHPVALAVNALRQQPALGAISYQHSPEHPSEGTVPLAGQEFYLKSSERGCSLVFASEQFERFRPLPVQQIKDFDWWVCRDAPHALQQQGKRIAVLPGGAMHLGWRRGDSTWQTEEIPEYHLKEEQVDEIQHRV